MRALDVPVNDDDALDKIKSMIDPDATGFITFARLIVVMEEKLKESDTVEDLMKQLTKLDRDGDGKIPSPEFKQYLMNMGNKMTSEEIEELMKEADPKGEGSVDIAEFAERICPPKPK